MTDVEFAEIVALGHERTGVEFKASGPLNARKSPGIFVAQVVRAILGMANRRDGGSVVIGVEDNDGSLNPVGVAPNELATWKYDRLADQVANYADPDINFGNCSVLRSCSHFKSSFRRRPESRDAKQELAFQRARIPGFRRKPE